MAVKTRTGSSVLKFLHFVVRFLGLNGLIAAAVGAWLLFALNQGEIGMIVIIAGGSAAALALLVELRGLTSAVASHRGAAGLNVFLQVALAGALVVGANVYSFEHFKRFDLTAKKIFTLDESLREKLARMRGDTEIIVYVQHVSFGQRVDLRQDDYDQAAGRVITDKVVDLVEQFKEAGPRFRVHILDTQKKSFPRRRDQIKAILGDRPTASATELEQARQRWDAIKNAPEDSIFFYSPDNQSMQRLSFNDLYHLDKKASEEANNKQGNLVLLDRGVQNFADKVFRIEEKKPRVGFAVVHGWLGQDGTDEYGMTAMKDMLPARGFSGRDIVLWNGLQVDPAALEAEESRYEQLDARSAYYRRLVKELETELKEVQRLKKYWDTTPLEQINKDYVLIPTTAGWRDLTLKELDEFRKATGRVPPTKPVTQEYKDQMIKEWPEDVEEYETELGLKKERLAKANEEKSKLHVDNLAEQRRITDVRDKFNRVLSDIDLLVIPRWTFRDLLRRGYNIDSGIYPMSPSHIDGIKDFIKSGKPVLFLLSPMNDAPVDPDDPPRVDPLEKMLAEFDIELPGQAILYSSDSEAMEEQRERRGSGGPGGGKVEIPPTLFYWKKSAGSRFVGRSDSRSPSPLATSLDLTVRGLGSKSADGLKIRHPRPVYVTRTTWEPATVARAVGALSLGWPAGPGQAFSDFVSNPTKRLDDKAAFLMTDTDCWNEDRPVPAGNYVPRFKRPKQSDPTKGTVQERRHGPFPIGAAVEAQVPREWYADDGLKSPKKVRLAVIGQGGVFAGEKLPPIREKLFVDVANWLLGREALLARETQDRWEYPRVTMKPETKTLWEWGARLGLPLVFVCLGMNVWLVRRMR